MIQHTHLTTWQAHAPWPKRSQIEQDLRRVLTPVLGQPTDSLSADATRAGT